MDLGDEEQEGREDKGRNPRQLSLLKKSCKKRKKEEDSSLYRKWARVPPLKNLVRLKTSAFGPRMNSTKNEGMFNEISSFQKVYISWVSEILKIVSIFCVKRLFCP